MNNKKSEKMGKMPIGKLLAVMSLPAMLSMLVQSLYNVVDSIYVSSISPKAFKALSIAFPVQIFLLAFAIGIGVGTNSLVSRKLGEKDFKAANSTAENGLFMSIVTAVIFSVCGLLFSGKFVSLFTDDLITRQMGTDYLTIVTVFSAGFFLEILLTKTLQATGNMIIPMISQLIGAISNIILDPIFIFGWFGMPAMGIKGAAIATVISQFTAFLFTAIMFKAKNHDVKLHIKGFKPDSKIIKNIMIVGIPAMVMNSIASFTIIILNGMLEKISEYGIPVLGVYFKLESFIFMPIFGLTQGALPIMGYNYGAKLKNRFISVYKLSIVVALIIMTAGMLLFLFFPKMLLSLFNANSGMDAVGIPALRILCCCFIPAAIGIMTSTMFQSIGHGLKALFMTLTRQVVLLVPVAIILSKPLGMNGIWLSFPIAEIISVLVFFPLALKTIPKLFNIDKKDNNYIIQSKYV